MKSEARNHTLCKDETIVRGKPKFEEIGQVGMSVKGWKELFSLRYGLGITTENIFQKDFYKQV